VAVSNCFGRRGCRRTSTRRCGCRAGRSRAEGDGSGDKQPLTWPGNPNRRGIRSSTHLGTNSARDLLRNWLPSLWSRIGPNRIPGDEVRLIAGEEVRLLRVILVVRIGCRKRKQSDSLTDMVYCGLNEQPNSSCSFLL
jgi:hypothetical protein